MWMVGGGVPGVVDRIAGFAANKLWVIFLKENH